MPSLPPAIDLTVHDRGAGALVVVLHDLAGDGTRVMRTFAPLVASGHRVVAPDLRGHGTSPTPKGPWSIDDIASDVARVVSQRGGPAVVVGQGLGAGAALALALGHPGLVGGLVMTGIGPRPEDGDEREPWAKVARAVRDRGAEGIALAAEAMAGRPDWRGALPQLETPAIILAGSRDRATPAAQQRDLAVWMRHARFQTVDAGHDVFGERPDLLMAAVRRLEAQQPAALAAA